MDVSRQNPLHHDPFPQALLHLDDGRRVPVEPDEVFFLEASGDETEVRTRGRRRLRDVRSLAEVTALFPSGLFVQIHRSWAINADRVAEVRRRDNGRDCEVKLRRSEAVVWTKSDIMSGYVHVIAP